MADTVGLLRYPTQWQGAINCTLQCFDDSLPYAPKHKPCAHNSHENSHYGHYEHSIPQAVQVCVCHGYCKRHCSPSIVPADQMWRNIIAPYVNIAVDNPWAAQVMSDSSRKLSALDPKNGLGVLHGLLLWSDDATLLEKFLELGVDTDIPFIHSNRNSYDGLANFDLATAAKLNYGTAAHFAAFFGRSKCLQALADIGANFNCRTKDGENPLDLAKDGSKEIIQDAVGTDGSKTLAWLAKEGKYFAIRYKIRLGKVTPAAFRVQCDGKTAVEWIWAKMIEWQFTMKMDQDSLIPFRIMAEMRYRYDVGAADFGTPPVLSMATDGGKEANQELLDEVKKVRESQQTILESICVLSGKAGVSEAKRKKPDGGADGRH